MNDSMEQTLKKVINDIDLQGDDEMVFIENREQGIEDYASTTTSVSMPNGASILPARPARRFGSISRRNSEKTALRWQGSWESSLGRKGLIRRWGFQTWQPTSRTLLSTITTNLTKGMAIWTMVRISYLHLKQGFYSS